MYEHFREIEKCAYIECFDPQRVELILTLLLKKQTQIIWNAQHVIKNLTVNALKVKQMCCDG